MKLIGLDIGTTGCKAALFESDGTLLSRASREYPVSIPQPGWAEQDAERVWQLACESLAEALGTAGRPRVEAIGLSVQGEAVMPLDAEGNALRPAILGMDTRTGEQNAWLADRFGAAELYARTGMPIHTINTLPKLLWLKQHEPVIWERASHLQLYEDFIIQKLTGRALISRCLASRTQLFDLERDCWSGEILDAIELEPKRLSQVQPSGTPAGLVKADLAERLGLPNRPLVVTGGHDQACGALGVGLTAPGRSMVSTGTAEVVEVALGSPALNKTLQQGNISVYAHVVPGLYLAMTLNHSGGLLLRWFRDVFCGAEKARAEQEHWDAYDLVLQDALPEPTSLLVLPHWSGSGTPHFDTASKGAILGLTFATTKTDVAKAILEGLTFELRYNLEVLEQGQVRVDELRAIGGGARSELWLQLKADITGVKVVTPRVTEAATWGAALLAGYGVGCIVDLKGAAEASVQLTAQYMPKPARACKYAERYALYRELYPVLAPLQHRM